MTFFRRFFAVATAQKLALSNMTFPSAWKGSQIKTQQVSMYSTIMNPTLCMRPSVMHTARHSLFKKPQFSLPMISVRPFSQQDETKGKSEKEAKNIGNDLPKKKSATATRLERLKEMVKVYGSVAVATHIGVSLVSLGSFVMAVRMFDVQTLLDVFHLQGSVAEGLSTFAVAYLLHKAALPFRLPVSLATIPVVVKVFNIRPKTSTENQADQEDRKL
eukprot:TRINITY_DN1540_c0_g5_i1.p1 TRINITY_DN1540_c0_g5~~TRINITY_DN1540_c0_g5_i1.p1  ORF type:complete len:217 (+),score=59.68 TRINITY_DN1540_c0_g5_i1:70-720(+)